MSKERLMQVLQAPHVTEKARRSGGYVFKVQRSANKHEIKRAVELMFEGVEVERVQVCNVKGKRVSHRRIPGRRAAWKKAYVSLKPGHLIDPLED